MATTASPHLGNTPPLDNPIGSSTAGTDERRQKALDEYRRLLQDCRDKEARLKDLRLGIRDFEKQYAKSERDIMALQSVGQIIGEVLKELDGTIILVMPML